MKLKAAFLLFILLVQVTAQAADYRCDFLWKTLSENAAIKDQPVSKKLNQKITEDLNAVVSIEAKSTKVQVKESYKDNHKNFMEYNFSCSSTLSCEGSRVSMVDGKKETTKIVAAPTSTFGLGKIESRELFKYENAANGFSYQYIVYKNESGEPMGLKVSCRK